MEEVITHQPVEQEITHDETKWYVLRVVSGKERKVKEYLDKEVNRSGWSETIKQVFLPMEKVYKVQNGKKVMREKNYFPGYVMIEVFLATFISTLLLKHMLRSLLTCSTLNASVLVM